MSLFRRPNSPYWYTEIQVAGVRVVRSTGCVQRRDAERFQRKLREDTKRSPSCFQAARWRSLISFKSITSASL